MTERQLFLPGLQPGKGWYFPDLCCGSVEYLKERDFVPTYNPLFTDNRMCGNKPVFLALYFRMRTVIAENHRDYIDDDTDRIYACGRDHLEAVIRELHDGELPWPEMSDKPDLIVNPRGEIEKELHLNLARRLGVKMTDRWFTGNGYSNGRDSLERLWAREKVAFF